MNELQSWGGWIVAALIGIIAILVTVFRKPKVVEAGPSDLQKTKDEEAQKAQQQAEQQKDDAKKEAQQQHDDALKKIEQQQQSNTVIIKDDPEAINDFLKDVGSQVR